MTLRAYLDSLSTPEKIEALQLEMHRNGERAAELATIVDGYDAVLRPVWDAEASIKAAITETHGARAYDASTRDERKLLFERLLWLSVDWGDVRNKRKDTNQMAKAYEREANKIANEIKFLRNRKERQRGKTRA